MTASSDFKKMRQSLRQLKRSLIDVIEVESERHFDENFQRSAYVGDSVQPWKPRKSPDEGRRLLVQSGDLRRAATTAKRNARGVRYVLNQVYARVHNEGGKAGRGAGFTMPKRQFIGRSKVMDRKIIKKMKEVIERHFNQIA